MSSTPRGFGRRAMVAGLVGTVGAALAVTAEAVGTRARADQRAVRIDPPEPTLAEWESQVIGRSVLDRPISIRQSLSTHERVHVLAVSGIHGDERAATPLVASFADVDRPSDVSLTILANASPDGWDAGTRNNANDVDVNRNFPWRFGLQDHGPFPASEPETQAIIELCETIRPDLVVFVHQPLGYVGPIGDCPEDYAGTWSAATGLRIRRGVLQSGGSETWASEVAGLHSMLIEVAGVAPTDEELDAHRQAFADLLAIVRPR